MGDRLLEVRNLKKYFKTKEGMLHAVDDVSFNINKGETLGLVGESGWENLQLVGLYLEFMSLQMEKLFIIMKIY